MSNSDEARAYRQAIESPRPRCPVCMEYFGTVRHVPKTPKCRHTVCADCVAAMARLVYAFGGPVCPVCRSPDLQYHNDIALMAILPAMWPDAEGGDGDEGVVREQLRCDLSETAVETGCSTELCHQIDMAAGIADCEHPEMLHGWASLRNDPPPTHVTLSAQDIHACMATDMYTMLVLVRDDKWSRVRHRFVSHYRYYVAEREDRAMTELSKLVVNVWTDDMCNGIRERLDELGAQIVAIAHHPHVQIMRRAVSRLSFVSIKFHGPLVWAARQVLAVRPSDSARMRITPRMLQAWNAAQDLITAYRVAHQFVNVRAPVVSVCDPGDIHRMYVAINVMSVHDYPVVIKTPQRDVVVAVTCGTTTAAEIVSRVLADIGDRTPPSMCGLCSGPCPDSLYGNPTTDIPDAAVFTQNSIFGPGQLFYIRCREFADVTRSDARSAAKVIVTLSPMMTQQWALDVDRVLLSGRLLKWCVHAVSSLPVEMIKLVHCGRLIRDSDMLADHNLHANPNVTIMMSPSLGRT